MKKYCKAILVLLVALTVLVGVSACMRKGADGLYILDTPKDVLLEGDTLTWGAVKYAETYFIKVDDKEYSTKSTSFVVQTDTVGEHKVSVRAYGDGKTYGYSDWSAALSYTKVARLQQPVVTITDKLATWHAVEHAVSYSVVVTDADGKQVDSATVETTQYSFDNAELYAQPNAYKIRVVANPEQGSTYTISPQSAEQKYLVTQTLAVPNFTADNCTSSRIRWDAVDKASGYRILITGQNGSDYRKEIACTSTSYATSALGLDDGATYDIQIKAVGDHEVYLDSAYTDKREGCAITKLPTFDASYVRFEVVSETGKPNLLRMELDLSALRAQDSDVYSKIQEVVVTLSAPKADGSTSLTALTKRFKINTEDNTDDALETVIDDLFYKIDDEGAFVMSQDESYFGKKFNITIQFVSDNSKVVASDSFHSETGYQSYCVPTYSSESGAYLITSAGELAYMYANPSATYLFTSDIDYAGYEFSMIAEFSGTINGNGYVIRNLVLEGNEESGLYGFIGTNTGTVSNLHFLNPAFAVREGAKPESMGVIAAINSGVIDGCAVFGGKVHAMQYAEKDAEHVYVKYAGGICGKNTNDATVRACQSTASTEGVVAGGLVGYNAGEILSSGVIADTTAVGDADSGSICAAGGLVGVNDGGQISFSYAIGNVSVSAPTAIGSLVAGGLVGDMAGGAVNNSYAGKMFSPNERNLNSVSASGNGGVAGGLIGNLRASAIVSNVYANTRVSATAYAGGLVGRVTGGAQIAHAFTLGGVINEGSHSVGFANVEDASVQIVNAYWYVGIRSNNRPNADTDTSGAVQIAAGDISTLAQRMQDGDNGGSTAFGAIAGKTAPVLRQILYMSAHEETIRVGTQIQAFGTYLDSSGAAHEIRHGDDAFVLSGATEDYDPTQARGTFAVHIAPGQIAGGALQTGGYLYITVKV